MKPLWLVLWKIRNYLVKKQYSEYVLIGIKLIIHFQLKITHTQNPHTHTVFHQEDNSHNVLIANPSNNWRSCNNELKNISCNNNNVLKNVHFYWKTCEKYYSQNKKESEKERDWIAHKMWRQLKAKKKIKLNKKNKAENKFTNLQRISRLLMNLYVYVNKIIIIIIRYIYINMLLGCCCCESYLKDFLCKQQKKYWSKE